jgi:hypothetical protein
VTTTVARAKRLVVEIRNVLRADHSPSKADGMMSRAERAMTELVECVEYLSNPERGDALRVELSQALLELRAEVWKVNDAVNAAVGLAPGAHVPVAKLVKARNRAIKAIDRIEDLLNVDKRCC